MSAFGPASELAKRLRNSRQRLARIDSDIDEGIVRELEIRQKLLQLQQSQIEAKEDDSKLRKISESLEQSSAIKQAVEAEIKNLEAEKRHLSAELSDAEHEQSTILRLLQNQLSAAQRQLQSKRSTQEQAELLGKQGLVSTENLSQAEQAVAEAEAEVRQLELLIEFYDRLGRE